MSRSIKKMCASLGINPEDVKGTDIIIPQANQPTIERVVPENNPPVTAPPSVEDMAIDDDYDFARNNLREIITQASTAISDMGEVARESESPRAYEVLATLLANAAKANEQLMALSKAKKEISGFGKSKGTVGETSTPGVSVQNAIFVGSTSDLGKLLREKRKELE